MKPVIIIAISTFFSAWGDRLWTFAVGLYLVKLTPGSFKLTAIYGLVLTASAFIFSPLIGGWIDRNNRLKAVSLLLVLQNMFVMIDGIVILSYLYNVNSKMYVLKIMQAFIIVLGAMANLAGQGEKICITKDWIVVICRRDSNMLAKANTLLRQIDLSVAIIAPIGVGFLMSVISDLAGIIFICSWNIITMIVEYLLLLRVYKQDTELQKLPNAGEQYTVNNSVSFESSNGVERGGIENTTADAIIITKDSACVYEPIEADSNPHAAYSNENVLEDSNIDENRDAVNLENREGPSEQDAQKSCIEERETSIRESDDMGKGYESADVDDTIIVIANPSLNPETSIASQNYSNRNSDSVNNPTVTDVEMSEISVDITGKSYNNIRHNSISTSIRVRRNISSRIKKLTTGWRLYKRQRVLLAGVSLSFLYLTVLGFNAITASFAYSQGLKEVYVSICFGCGSLVGIAGTFLFPRIRKKIGLVRTGLVGNMLQFSFLLLCAASIWLPGSPSKFSLRKSHLHANNANIAPTKGHMNSVIPPVSGEGKEFNNISVIILMVGIILSRAGLWIADLTITQIQQEYVEAGERGAVGGGQYALNCFFDLIQFIVTIFLPYPHQFWILIFMSLFAVFAAFVTYFVFIFNECAARSGSLWNEPFSSQLVKSGC